MLLKDIIYETQICLLIKSRPLDAAGMFLVEGANGYPWVIQTTKSQLQVNYLILCLRMVTSA